MKSNFKDQYFSNQTAQLSNKSSQVFHLFSFFYRCQLIPNFIHQCLTTVKALSFWSLIVHKNHDWAISD